MRGTDGLIWRARSRAGAVAEAVEGHVARLVGGEAGALLARCGLAEIAERVRCAPPMIYPLAVPVTLAVQCAVSPCFSYSWLSHTLRLHCSGTLLWTPWGVWGLLFPVLH